MSKGHLGMGRAPQVRLTVGRHRHIVSRDLQETACSEHGHSRLGGDVQGDALIG